LQASTTELGKLFQILTMRAEKTTTTLCLKKTSHLWLAIILTQMNHLW